MVSDNGGQSARGQLQIKSFDNETNLKASFDEFLDASNKCSLWTFNAVDIYYASRRGDLVKGLHTLESYIKEIASENEVSTLEPCLNTAFEKSGLYVLNLFLEAEWLCMSKGFSTICIAVLEVLPQDSLINAASSYVAKHILNCNVSLNKKACNVYTLVTCGATFPLVYRVLFEWLLDTLPSEQLNTTHDENQSTKEQTHDNNCRILLLKSLNRIVLPNDTVLECNTINLEKVARVFTHLCNILINPLEDRDVLSHAGIATAGVYVTLRKNNNHDADTLEFFWRLFSLSATSTPAQNAHEDDFKIGAEFEDKSFNQLFSRWPILSCIYLCRGVLFWLCSNQEDVIDCTKESSKAGEQSTFGPDASSLLCLCMDYLKMKSASTVRVDVNYAILQTLQTVISSINVTTFQDEKLYQQMLQLPRIMLRYWPSRIRRVSNLAVSLWKKLFEVCHRLVKQNNNNTRICNYIDHLVHLSLDNSFQSKLKYVALKIALPYVGIGNLLSREPLLIPHLFTNLVDPAMRGACSSLLADVLGSVHMELKRATEHVEDLDRSSVVRITFCRIVYPIVTAILHLKRLVYGNINALPVRLHPRLDGSIHGRQLTADAVTNTFKTVFKKIEHDCVFELLALSTCYDSCDFYIFSTFDERQNLDQPGIYNLHENQFDPSLLLESTLGIVRSQLVHDEPNPVIIDLQGPITFAESMCLFNSRVLNRVEFVDTEYAGEKYKGILIYDKTVPGPFEPYKLDMYTNLRIFYIGFDRLKSGAQHTSDEVCLNILRVITASPKSTEPIHPLEMDLFAYILRHRIKTSLPLFRQHFIAALKPFIRRLYALVTTPPNNGNAQAGNEDVTSSGHEYKECRKSYLSQCEFVRCFLDILFDTLDPCASDFGNTTALEVLLLIYREFENTPANLTSFIGIYDADNLKRLFYGIFIFSNKQQDIIYQIFQRIDTQYTREALFKSPMLTRQLLNKAMVSLWTIKTIQYSSGSKALAIALYSSIDDSRVNTNDTLHRLFLEHIFQYKGLPGLKSHLVMCYLDAFLQHLSRFCSDLNTSISIDSLGNASSPVGLLCFLGDFLGTVPPRIYTEFVNSTQFRALFNRVVVELKTLITHVLKFLGKDPLEDRPMYVDCRGHVVNSNITEETKAVVEPRQTTRFCFLANEKFNCCNATPTVNLMPKCLDAEDDMIRAFSVLCWKTCHAACSALRGYLQWILPKSHNGAVPLAAVRRTSETNSNDIGLYYTDIRHIGTFLISCMMYCRHFGCLDGLGDLLAWLAKALERLGFYDMLKHWINFLLSIIQTTVDDERLRGCVLMMLKDAHKRSEPLALAFSSILKAESNNHEAVLLPMVMENLCELAKAGIGEKTTVDCNNDVKIHALNILAAIFRTSELRISNYEYAVGTLTTCLENMSHGDWSVRNSSALLFTAIIQHLSGNDINDSTSDVLVEHQLPFISSPVLIGRINEILEALQNVDKQTPTRETEPTPLNAPIYQGVAFVLNFLNRVPLYSFHHDALDQLLRNIEYALTCQDASLRCIAANVLARFACETNTLLETLTSTSNTLLDLTKKSRESNRENGHLLLQRQLVKQGLSFDFNEAACGLLDAIRNDTFEHLAETDSVNINPLALVQYACLRIYTNTACIENQMQVILLYEDIIHSLLASTDSVEALRKFQSCSGLQHAQLVQTSALLALTSTNMLGNRVVNTITSILTKVTNARGICFENAIVEHISDKYPRIRNDPIPGMQAARCLVFALYYMLHSNGVDGNNANIDAYVSVIEAIENDCHHKVLGSIFSAIDVVLENASWHFLEGADLARLWDVVISIRKGSVANSILTSVQKLLNTIMQIVLAGNVNHDIQAHQAVDPVFKQRLHTREYLAQLVATIHLNSFYKCVDDEIYKLGCQLLYQVSNAEAVLSLRLHVSSLFASVGIPSHNGEDGGLSMYVLHAYQSLLMLLQDDNNEVRENASRGVCKILQIADLALHPNVCLKPMLSKLKREFSMDDFVKLCEFFNSDKTLYKLDNLCLQRLGNTIAAQQGSIPLFTRDIENQDGLDLTRLADMDTLFNKEPLNMYAEPAYTILEIDKLFMQGILDAAFGPEEWDVLRAFAHKYAILSWSRIVDHCKNNYKVDLEVEANMQALGTAITCDAVLALNILSGLCKCSIALHLSKSDSSETRGIRRVFKRLISLHSFSEDQLYESNIAITEFKNHVAPVAT